MRWTLLLPLAATISLAVGKASTNARCGNAYNALPGGMTCTGSQWGDCCSQYGYCGKTKGYCGTGCQSPFGTCNSVATSARVSTTSSRSSTSSARTAPSTAPSSTAANVKVTTNARCGNAYGASPAGMTCSGGKYGDCCSEYSYCGSSSAYCGKGCQAGFGKCDTVSSSSTISTVSSSTLSTYSSSSSSISSSSSAPLSISSHSDMDTSTSSSEPTSSDTSISSSVSVSSSASTEVLVTSASSTLTMSSSTASPSPTADALCGVVGFDVVDLQVISTRPFTSVSDCLASCRAESGCESLIKYAGNCYTARIPITSANVRADPASQLTFYNRDCEANPLAATVPPTTLATTTPSPTSTTSTSTSTVCIPPAPTVSCVKYPTCQKFTAGLENSCPAYGGQCQDNYFVRCENTPAAGSQTLLVAPNIPIDLCRQTCDGVDNCMAFSYKGTTCSLWKTLNGFVSAPDTTVFIRICPVATCSSAPVRRHGSFLVGVKSPSIEKWNGSA